jgi:hypothetical protein
VALQNIAIGLCFTQLMSLSVFSQPSTPYPRDDSSEKKFSIPFCPTYTTYSILDGLNENFPTQEQMAATSPESFYPFIYSYNCDLKTIILSQSAKDTYSQLAMLSKKDKSLS